LGKKERNAHHIVIGQEDPQFCDLEAFFEEYPQVNSLTIEIQRYANVKIYDIMNLPGKDKMEITCIISDYAQLYFFISTLETKNRKYTFVLQGKSCQATLHGFYLLSDKQKLCVHVAQNHIGESAQSKVIMHGVIAGDAQCDFTGTVFVAETGKKAMAQQENKTLVFGRAQISSQPCMEILNNNDVVCKHASAVGNIDETQLFYLQSRGLTQSQAKKLMVEGFLNFWLNALDNIAAKKSIAKCIQEKIGRIL